MDFPEKLSNDKLFLRELAKKDWAAVHEYASQEQVCRHQPWGPNSEDDSKAFVNETLEDAVKNPRTRYVMAVIHKADEKMIGAGEFNVRDVTNKIGEISYIINPDYWGKGIATDVARLLIEFGFNEFKLHRIYATCAPENIASAKVLEKTGMTKEGTLREVLRIKGRWRDSLMYSILEHERSR